jgi:hypothetical protein
MNFPLDPLWNQSGPPMDRLWTLHQRAPSFMAHPLALSRSLALCAHVRTCVCVCAYACALCMHLCVRVCCVQVDSPKRNFIGPCQ